jgi:hypothetical protein
MRYAIFGALILSLELLGASTPGISNRQTEMLP